MVNSPDRRGKKGGGRRGKVGGEGEGKGGREGGKDMEEKVFHSPLYVACHALCHF